MGQLGILTASAQTELEILCYIYTIGFENIVWSEGVYVVGELEEEFAVLHNRQQSGAKSSGNASMQNDSIDS